MEGRYDFGQHTGERALEIYVYVHTHTSGVTSNMLSAATSDCLVLISYCSLPQSTDRIFY